MQVNKNYIIPFVGLIFLSVILTVNPQSSEREGETCIDNAFCFIKPIAFKKVEVIAIDSIAGQFKSDVISMYYDYGLQADQFSHWSSIVPQAINIDNRIGEVLVNGSSVALRVEPNIDGNKLSILLNFEGPIKEELAFNLFKSIRFL